MAPKPPSLADLLALRSRGELKRWGAWLDGEGEGMRPALEAHARARGLDPEGLDGRRLLRLCLDRAEGAQVRKNPIARDEAFRCAHCGAAVPAGGRRPRDHCPACLYSLHVDVVPGDRAADCGGELVPVAILGGATQQDIRYRCARCGAIRVNRVLDDLDPPDALAVVLSLPRG